MLLEDYSSTFVTSMGRGSKGVEGEGEGGYLSKQSLSGLLLSGGFSKRYNWRGGGRCVCQ